MNGFKHKIAQAWVDDASQRPLPAWKKKLVLAHLQKCADCRSFAASLAEFNYGFAGNKKRPALEREVMRRSVMAAFVRERAKEPAPEVFAYRPAPVLVAAPADPMRPLFLVSFGAAAVALICLALLAQPFRPSSDSGLAAPTIPGTSITAVQPTPNPSAVPETIIMDAPIPQPLYPIR